MNGTFPSYRDRYYNRSPPPVKAKIPLPNCAPLPPLHKTLHHLEDLRIGQWGAAPLSELNGPAPNSYERQQIELSIVALQQRIVEIEIEIAMKRAIKAPIRLMP